MKNKVLMIVLAGFLLVGCGGGSDTKTGDSGNSGDSGNGGNSGDSGDAGNGGNTPTFGTGTYVDSPIKGVRYECGSKIGLTGDTGSFEFEVGKPCMFKINNLNLTAVAAEGLMEGVVVKPNLQIARFLQSIDLDGNAANGIEIHADVVAALQGVSINPHTSTYAEIQTVVGSLSGVSVYNGSAKTLEEAAEHLAGFSVDVAANNSSYTLGDTVTFTANITGNSVGLVYAWAENGTAYADNGNQLVVNNFNLGGHTVDVNVTNTDGYVLSDSITIMINEVPNIAPVARAGSNIEVDFNTSISFDGSSSSDADGNIVKYEWSYNGTTLNNVTHISTYNTGLVDNLTDNNGTHIITLKVTDNDNATHTDTVTVIVGNP